MFCPIKCRLLVCHSNNDGISQSLVTTAVQADDVTCPLGQLLQVSADPLLFTERAASEVDLVCLGSVSSAVATSGSF